MGNSVLITLKDSDLRPQILMPNGNDGPCDRVPLITLPGKGDRGEGCGQDVPYHCNHCGSSFIVESSCMLRTCPNCFRKWAWKEAKTAALRLWSGVSIIAPRRTGRRIVHAVVSLRHTGLDLKVYRSRAVKIAKAHGLTGGLAIFHPFRDQGDGFVPDGHVHFHFISLARGNILPGDSKDYVFKIIQDAKRKDFRGYKFMSEVRATVMYLLTHCGIMKGRHALTWYGELSYNQLSNGALEAKIPGLDLHPKHKIKCPVCHGFDIEPDWITDYTDWSSPYFIDNRLKAG